MISDDANPVALVAVRTHAKCHEIDVVQQFNALNLTIGRDIPGIARSSVLLQLHVPLLRQMQNLLSQRPKGTQAESPFAFGTKRSGRVMPTLINNPNELPSWTRWLTEYSKALGYSVRHLQRVILNEPRKKFVKACGWSVGDHNALLRAATLGGDLANATAAGADTTALVAEVNQIFKTVNRDLLDKPFELEKLDLRKRPAKRVS